MRGSAALRLSRAIWCAVSITPLERKTKLTYAPGKRLLQLSHRISERCLRLGSHAHCVVAQYISGAGGSEEVDTHRTPEVCVEERVLQSPLAAIKEFKWRTEACVDSVQGGGCQKYRTGTEWQRDMPGFETKEVITYFTSTVLFQGWRSARATEVNTN